MHLASIDLNLLLSLHALLDERSVTLAARRVGLTQSAMSHALARLRELFGDPLLVRSSKQMLLTPRAEGLLAPLADALARLEGAISENVSFDPGQADGVFSIACEDYISSLLVPRLLRRISREAPAMDIDVQARDMQTSARLAKGSVDIAIGVFRGPSGAMRQRLLFSENFACVVRRDHPEIRKRLTLKRYVELPHLLVGDGPRGRGAVDVALERAGKERRVAVRVGTFLSAPLIVAETDLILTIPKRLATRFARVYDLQLFDPPIAIADFKYHCRWHERWQHDGRHQWLRQLVADESDKLRDESARAA